MEERIKTARRNRLLIITRNGKKLWTCVSVKYAEQLKSLVDKGFSAAVYTQTTDVGGEVNGLMRLRSSLTPSSGLKGDFCFSCLRSLFLCMYRKPFVVKKFFIRGLPDKSIIMFKFAV